ncbi:MAG: hypothetical protein RR293_01025 [Bacteroidales bacterium]
MTKHKCRNRVAAIFLTLIFSAYYGGSTLFPHAHLVNNALIVHNHPYTSAEHSHSAASYASISFLSNILFIIAASPLLLSVILRLIALLTVMPISGNLRPPLRQYSLRAPPQLF